MRKPHDGLHNAHAACPSSTPNKGRCSAGLVPEHNTGSDPACGAESCFLELETFAYVQAKDFRAFLKVQEELMLQTRELQRKLVRKNCKIPLNRAKTVRSSSPPSSMLPEGGNMLPGLVVKVLLNTSVP
ncbi:hypothetical protein [Pontibacter rugosus]|uniref:SPX domain-containing protein n=1 Tax=Pontibacter rugosus TaxID=1745966 RepID=A0ABW3SSX5_9BACT